MSATPIPLPPPAALRRVWRAGAENFTTAVSIVSMPDMPARDRAASPAARGRLAERYLASLGVLTEGLGPTMLVKAREGSGVITTEL